MDQQSTSVGPGRIDPFNPIKFHQLEMGLDDTIGNSDMMPIWKMRSRHGHFHWDGLNTDLTEVVLSGAIGDGATNKSLPVEQLKKVEDYINDVHPPAYPFPRNIDVKLVARGNEIYQQLCADCHSSTGKRNGTVIPLAEIGTDRHRANMWVAAAVERYHGYSEGYDWDFRHFVDVEGYVAVPLDGLWLRAPFLHNGSVPTLEALFSKSADRPRSFYRGYDVYDVNHVGFVHDLKDPGAQRFGYLYKIDESGNSNVGHEGPEYGTELPDDDKRALIEYLKTL